MDTQVQKVLPLIKERGQKNKSFSSYFNHPLYFGHIVRSLYLFSLFFCMLFIANSFTGCMSQHRQKRKLDLTSKRGVGFTHTLSSIKGLNLQYGINNRFIFESIMGGYVTQNNLGSSDFKWGGTFGTIWQLLKIEDEAFVGLGLRYVYTSQRQCVQENNTCSTQNPFTIQTTTKAFELPIRIAWYPHRVVSVHLDFGLSIAWDNLETLLPSEIPQRWEFFESRNQWGNLGLTVWF